MAIESGQRLNITFFEELISNVKYGLNLRSVQNVEDLGFIQPHDFIIVRAPLTITLPTTDVGLDFYIKRVFTDGDLILKPANENLKIEGLTELKLFNYDTVHLFFAGNEYLLL